MRVRSFVDLFATTTTGAIAAPATAHTGVLSAIMMMTSMLTTTRGSVGVIVEIVVAVVVVVVVVGKAIFRK